VAWEKKATNPPSLFVEGVSVAPEEVPASGVALLFLETRLVTPFAPVSQSWM
jgi:hypothetical protein